MDERTNAATGGGEQPPQTFPVPRTSKDGKPAYDQEFFLALARLGKDAWNHWEEENHKIWVTFEGVDFREPANESEHAKMVFVAIECRA